MVSAFINVYLISQTSALGLGIQETLESRLAFDRAVDTFLKTG